MGEIYRAECPKCGYSAQFNLGGGRMSLRPSYCMSALNEKEQEAFRRMREDGEAALCMAENVLVKSCACGGKSTLAAKSIVTVTDRSGGRHVFADRCAACGKELVRYEDAANRNAEVPCPDCGGILEFKETGLWD